LAAQYGLDAQLSWPNQAGAPELRSARDVLLGLLDEAERGLAEAGVDPTERVRYLSVFAARVESGQTAAVWQSRQLAALRASGLPLDTALAELLEHYIVHCGLERPVHLWPVSTAPLSTSAAAGEDDDAAPVRDSEIFEVSRLSALNGLDAHAALPADEAGRV
jgi:hypothetical protein